MENTLFFYDLETSGFDPRTQRIMQFAGQRTTLDLEPIGEPVDVLIELTSDVLPDADAILVTGITPQRTRAEGLTEKQFLDMFHEDVATPRTIFLGFNSIRFDDEFMRSIHYRNLFDPYEWQWKDGRGKWDLLDVVRMTRALRPEGIKWPFSKDGRPANRLELIASINGLEHTHAHNALSDVRASIEVAKLIYEKQPKLFQYLLEMRDKQKIKDFAASNEMFVYTSGRYESEFEKTTSVTSLGECEDGSGAIVYDLRIDPDEWLSLSQTERESRKSPLKVMKFNHCPAVAPMSVLDEASWRRIGLTRQKVEKHYHRTSELKERLINTLEKKSTPSPQSMLELPIDDVDARMYDGFYKEKDKKLCTRIHDMSVEELLDFEPEFDDPRLPGLFFLYKARQFPKSQLADDRAIWEQYLERRLLGGGDSSRYARFMKRLEELARLEYLDADKRYVLEELALYAQSVVPLQGY
jgi:exodeoxyribonuclease-1